MIAHLKLQILRWSRRPGGQGAVLAALLFPTLASLYCLYEAPPDVAGVILNAASMALYLVGGMFLASVIATAVYEERVEGRGRLLRASGLDGPRAVGSFVLFALVLAFVVSVTGLAGPVLIGLTLGLGAAEWAAAFHLVAALLATLGPIAIASGYLLPRLPALFLANAAAVSLLFALLTNAAEGRFAFALDAGAHACVVGIEIAVLAGLAVAGTRIAERLWS